MSRKPWADSTVFFKPCEVRAAERPSRPLRSLFAGFVRAKLVPLLKDTRTIDGLSFTFGAVVAALFWAYLNHDKPEPPADPCSSVPYSVGDRPQCLEVAP